MIATESVLSTLGYNLDELKRLLRFAVRLTVDSSSFNRRKMNESEFQNGRERFWGAGSCSFGDNLAKISLIWSKIGLTLRSLCKSLRLTFPEAFTLRTHC
ncbi:hypothetical protein AVEN_252771-1 [Araneus ventricosus]|uniref:Uncharacterized protein n=1 Tax=Araneus ventricosus TaxID=182803 RepID=A0A4Y1ZV24_ARAVE|nr:hypothetical protein AVEN_252771-1 [Araneus ventricosus]